MQYTAARIKPLSNFLYRAMQVGVLLVAAGTILGGVWADVSWGRFWGWDAKEVWALITLLVYLVPLHGRFAGWVNTFGLVASSVFCFASVLMAWYGVNFVLGTGLHTYGFVEGGGQGIVLTCALAVMAVVGRDLEAQEARFDGLSLAPGGASIARPAGVRFETRTRATRPPWADLAQGRERSRSNPPGPTRASVRPRQAATPRMPRPHDEHA